MAEWLNRWGKFLTESKEPIEEATEEEIADLDQILHNLDPKDLSFNNIFGDRMRLAVPLDEENAELYDIIRFLSKNGYDVDTKKGIVTGYYIQYDDGSKLALSGEQKERLLEPDGKVKTRGRSPEAVEKSQRMLKKRQLKLGKLLQKAIQLATKGEALKYTELLGGTPVSPEVLQGMLDKWSKRGATKSGYTIIVSRHPLDVFRMSDFERIQSCHSPPSRGGGGEYYKCAVAEAHGHGLVAYLVRNEDLNGEIETRELKEGDYQTLLDKYQENDEEFFYDDYRNEGDITPINRVRIRKYASPEFGMTIAVPDEVVYGDKALDDPLVATLRNWSKKTQEDIFKKIADTPEMFRDDKLDLNKWVQHGGTYRDTDQGELMKSTLGHETTGYMEIDRTTENNLELTTGIEAVEEQAIEMVNNYNRRYSYSKAELGEIQVEDMNFFIPIEATITITIDEDEFVSSAYSGGTPDAIQGIPEYLSEYGLAVSDDQYSRVYYRARGGQVEIDIPLDMEMMNPEGGGTAFGLDNLDDILIRIDAEDDKHGSYEELARQFLTQQGVLKGSGLQELANELNSETWHEWDITIDDDYNPEEIEMKTNTYVNLNDLIEKLPVKLDRNPSISSMVKVLFDGSEIAEVGGVYDGEGNLESLEIISDEFEGKKVGGFKNLDEVREYAKLEIAKMIVAYGSRMGGFRESSRDFHLAVRNEMREAAGGVDGEWSYPRSRMIASSSPDSDDEWKMVYEMTIFDDEDEQGEAALETLRETDDEDKLKEIFRRAFAKAAKIPVATNEVRQYFRKFNLY